MTSRHDYYVIGSKFVNSSHPEELGYYSCARLLW